jgi:hypothetical protein
MDYLDKRSFFIHKWLGSIGTFVHSLARSNEWSVNLLSHHNEWGRAELTLPPRVKFIWELLRFIWQLLSETWELARPRRSRLAYQDYWLAGVQAALAPSEANKGSRWHR